MVRLTDDEYAREMTQHEPLAIPPVPGAFFIKVKVDHEGVFRPKPADYVYEHVRAALARHEPDYLTLLAQLEHILNGPEMARITPVRADDIEPYWENHMFEGADARMLYALVAHRGPERVIEVGSGHSSKFIRRAIKDHGLATQLISIDPVPRDEIKKVSDEVIYESVFDLDVSIFSRLKRGDILFWDGSHIVFNGTDTTHLYMNIMPLLPPGVLLHIHDIQLPFEYDRGYSAHYYNEQYMLGALLLNSEKWKTILPLRYVGAYLDARYTGRSFWLEKLAA